jgi:hypothetical protein
MRLVIIALLAIVFVTFLRPIIFLVWLAGPMLAFIAALIMLVGLPVAWLMRRHARRQGWPR